MLYFLPHDFVSYPSQKASDGEVDGLTGSFRVTTWYYPNPPELEAGSEH